MNTRDTEPLITGTDVREMARLLGEVAAMDPAPGARRNFLMRGLATLLDVDAWVWGVAPLLVPGQQPVYLYPQTGGFDEERFSRYLVAVEHPDTGAMTAPLAEAMIAAASQVTRRADQIVSAERFRNSPAWPYWQAADIGPILITVHPLPGEGVSCIGFYRAAESPMFTPRESRIAHIMLSEVSLLHRSGLPHREALAAPRLPPRCRLVLNHLVSGLPRKDIARHLRLSTNTVNGYTKLIFNHFEVHSQPELIARFHLGDGGDTPDLGARAPI